MGWLIAGIYVGSSRHDHSSVDEESGELLPVVTTVTDNDGQFRSFRFEASITLHPELHHVRTRVRTPGQGGSRMSGFGSKGAPPACGGKYEWLFREEIDHGRSLVEQIDAYRLDYNHTQPHD